ncbi:MAG: molybdenum cofactor biosynthesis protein, partial [Acidobacteria bacterium]|nr:molybdenum cofactor biosynthesis protein [Acidobacteriota bacterium]
MSHTAHRAEAPRTICCAVVTVSDTRTEETDRGGGAIVELLSRAGHAVAAKTIVPDDPDRVRGAVQAGVGAA